MGEEGGLGIRRLEIFNVALITSHIWSILVSKESLWVKWIHTHKLRGRNFRDVPFRGSMTWSWRKILHVPPMISRFFWYKVGNGISISAWFDNWCSFSPLMTHLSARQIHMVGFNMTTKVVDIISNGEWIWPSDWNVTFPNALVPVIDAHTPDSLGSGTGMESLKCSRLDLHGMTFVQESLKLCGLVLYGLRSVFLGTLSSFGVVGKVKAGNHQVSDSWDSIVNGISPLPNKRSINSIVGDLFWLLWFIMFGKRETLVFFKQTKRTKEQLIDTIMATVRLKLLSVRFKNSSRVERVMDEWDLPTSLMHNHVAR